MRLATIRVGSGTTAVRIEGDRAFDLGVPDVGALLNLDSWEQAAQGAGETELSVEELDYERLVLAPQKIICVGHNYESHILEMGRDLPTHPALFAKFADSLTGAHDDVVVGPAGQGAIDWEAELAIVVGRELWQADADEAKGAIAGFSVLNDVSMRDWQTRSVQWFQGKNWEGATPLGPHLVTPDELGDSGLEIWCEVDGERVQSASTGDLVFEPAMLLAYISTFTRLRPGDVIATGTPGGVGHARKPQVYLNDGQVVTVGIEGIGTISNRIRFAQAA